MSHPRIFQTVSLAPHTMHCLDERASHHLMHVLRAGIGESVTLFNGQGGEYQGVIARIEKSRIWIEIGVYVSREAESPLKIHLAQGIARGEKMDVIIQKAVELGVTQISPLFTERSSVKWDSERSEKRLSHWHSIIISACKQCGRNCVPEMEAAQPLKTWLPRVKVEHR